MLNAEPYIVQTLTSILVEKDVDIEVVVVNDKSTDRSLEKVLSVGDNRIRIIDGPGAGLSACLNAGFSAATGSIVMQCDADDLYPEDRIKTQVAWLDANPEYDAVCGGFSTLDATGRLVAELERKGNPVDLADELRSGRVRTSLCTYAFRKSAIQRIEGFRSYFVTSCDIDFQFRFGEVAKVMYLPQLFYMYRLHDASMTHTQGNIKRLFFEDIARTFLLQRRESGKDDLQRGNPPEPPEARLDVSGTADKQIRGMLIGAAWREHGMGNKWQAITLGGRALKYSPLDFRMWRSFFALVVKPPRRN
jgi:glycosyltransferase involved in cell wall biosynthesis